MSKKQNSSFFITLLIILLAPIGQAAIDIYVTALPEMRDSYLVSQSQMQLSVSLYLIAFAIGQMIYGPVSDAWGRKPTLFLGISIYMAGSVLAILSHDFNTFIVARIIQGLGITAASVVMKAIATDNFKDSQLGNVLTYMVISWGMGPIIAPVIGARLQLHFGWESCLYFLAAYGVILLVMLALFKESLKKSVPLTIGTLVNNSRMIVGEQKFQICFLAMGLCYGILLTFNLVAPFIVQDVLGYSPAVFGNIALLMGAAYFLGVFSNRFNKGRIPVETLYLSATTINVLASIAMVVYAYQFGMNIYSLVVPCLIMTFFAGVMYPNLMGKGVSLFPELGGLASSLLGFLLMLLAGLIMVCASYLNTESLVPLSVMFLIINGLCFLLIRKLVSGNQAVVRAEA
jgi:Bcr/CflA subfamily drug resistance transporter